MFPFFKQSEDNNAPSMAEVMQIGMKIIQAIASKDKDAMAAVIMPMLTPENVAKASKGIIEYFIHREKLRGQDVKLRVMIASNAEGTDIVLMIYEFEGAKGTPIFEKNLSQFTSDELKPLVDAILSNVFSAQ